MQDPARAVATGAACGVAATVAMSGLMLLARRENWIRRHPPEEIVERTMQRATGSTPSEEQVDAAAAIAHLAFGAVGGSAFAALWSKVRPPVPEVIAGIGWGTAIFAISYLGWAPALRLTPPAAADDRERPVVMVVAHWLYGAVLGLLADRLTGRHQEGLSGGWSAAGHST